MRIAIVGAGISGLTAGALLASRGQDVTIFEAKPHIGGVARDLTWAGRRFSPGPQYMWGLGPSGDAWPILHALGISFPTVSMGPTFQQLALGEKPFAPVDDTAHGLHHVAPDQHAAYLRAVALLDGLGRAGRVISTGAGFREAGHRMVRAVTRSTLSWRDKRWVIAHRDASVADLARRCGLTPATLRLLTIRQGIFAESLEDLSAVVFAAARHHLLESVALPVGGFGTLIDGLERAVRGAGATLHLGCRIRHAANSDFGTTLSVEDKTRTRQVLPPFDHVIWACSPGVIGRVAESAQVSRDIGQRFEASHRVHAVVAAYDFSPAAQERLRQRDFTWFSRPDDVVFDRTSRPDAHVPTMNFASPTLNADTPGPRHVVCAFAPEGYRGAELLNRLELLLQRVGVTERPVDTLDISPDVWTARFGAYAGATYGRRLSARSLRQSVSAVLPAGWHLAHSGGGIPGLLGCLQMGHAVAEQLVAAPARLKRAS